MKPVWRYSLVGLVAYFLFVMVLFPADRAFALLKQQGTLPLEGYQISGTLWHGRLGRVRIAGTNIDNIGWRLHPWALLLGRLEMDLRFLDESSSLDLPNESPIEIVVGRKLGGAYYLRHSGATLDMAALEKRFNKQPYGLTGDISFDLEDIHIVAGQLANISGNLSWQQAGLSAPLNIELGGFDMILETTDGVLQGTLKDNGGPLQVEGVMVLSADKSYRLTMTLRSRDKTRSDIKQALRMFGTPSPDGKVSFVRRGRFDFASLLR